jgi:hypothetical protein
LRRALDGPSQARSGAWAPAKFDNQDGKYIVAPVDRFGPRYNLDRTEFGTVEGSLGGTFPIPSASGAIQYGNSKVAIALRNRIQITASTFQSACIESAIRKAFDPVCCPVVASI